MKIAVDLDGVCFDSQKRWADLYHEWYGVDLTGLATEWTSLLDLTRFKTPDEAFAWFTACQGWATTPWIPGAKGGMEAIEAMGHNIVYVTERKGAECRMQTKQAIWPHLPQHRGFMFDVGRKGVAKCGVYIDDSPEVIDHLLDKDLWPSGSPFVICYSQPWNAGYEPTSNKRRFRRANNWLDVQKIIKEMA